MGSTGNVIMIDLEKESSPQLSKTSRQNDKTGAGMAEIALNTQVPEQITRVRDLVYNIDTAVVQPFCL